MKKDLVMRKTAVYPGSFDPLTLGHLDVIERAQNLFEKTVILVAKSYDKNPLFSVDERTDMVQESVLKFGDKVQVVSWGGLTVDFMKENQISTIVRGVRSSVDFRMEQTLANVNAELFSSCETVLLCCRPQFRDLSSRLVKEIASHGGELSKFVPDHVKSAIENKIQTRKKVMSDETF